MQMGIGEQRQDVFEEDAFGGEIGELTNGALEGYLKTGEFGGGGGRGGGESVLGGLCGGIELILTGMF